jgi:hypothetical protein
MERPDEQAPPAAPRPADVRAAVAAAPPVHEPAPPSDAGEPMGSKDPDRPAMLGTRFRATMAIGMGTGVVIALIGHVLLAHSAHGPGSTGWSWLLAAIGGVAVGGACTLFIYGTSTDRTDTGSTKAHGRADVGETGEWQKTLDRRRLGRRRRGPRTG